MIRTNFEYDNCIYLSDQAFYFYEPYVLFLFGWYIEDDLKKYPCEGFNRSESIIILISWLYHKFRNLELRKYLLIFIVQFFENILVEMVISSWF